MSFVEELLGHAVVIVLVAIGSSIVIIPFVLLLDALRLAPRRMFRFRLSTLLLVIAAAAVALLLGRQMQFDYRSGGDVAMLSLLFLGLLVGLLVLKVLWEDVADARRSRRLGPATMRYWQTPLDSPIVPQATTGQEDRPVEEPADETAGRKPKRRRWWAKRSRNRYLALLSAKDRTVPLSSE